MTNDDGVLGDIEAAVHAGANAVDVEDRVMKISLEDGVEVPVALIPSGMAIAVMHDVIKASRKLADAPPRRIGTAIHQELDSFCAHVNRFKSPDSAVWADSSKVTLTAVLNYHSAEQPAWGDHRAVYACPLSREWQLWAKADGVAFSQDAFAEFIEANMQDLVGPDKDDGGTAPYPARLLEIARTLRVHAKSAFERTTNPTTGEVNLVAKTEHESSSTKIPTGFFIGIPVFEAGPKYRVEARMRFALKEGRPVFAFILALADAVKRDAFNEVRAKVAATTALPVFAGTPENTAEGI